METNELLESLIKTTKNINQALRMLKNINRLSADLEVNLSLIHSNLIKLQMLSNECKNGDPIYQTILLWIEDFKKEITASQEYIRTQFGISLERELASQGYTLAGNYPLFTAGFFTVEANHQKWISKIWYGPKQELLDTSQLSALRVASRIKTVKENLGSKMPNDSFLKLLYSVYQKLSDSSDKTLPIKIIHSEVSDSIHPPDVDAGKDTVSRTKKYRRADFSYDLYRIRDLPGHPDLVVATRAFTRRREDFLWIPTDENGKGAVFSHLKFQEK